MPILVQRTLGALVDFAVQDENGPKKLLKYCKADSSFEHLQVVTVDELSSCCLFASTDYKLRTVVDFLSNNWNEIFHTFSIADENQLHTLEGALTKLRQSVERRNVTGIRCVPILGRLFTLTLQSDFAFSPSLVDAIRQRAAGSSGSCFLSEVSLIGNSKIGNSKTGDSKTGDSNCEPNRKPRRHQESILEQLEPQLHEEIEHLLRGKTIEKGAHEYLVSQIQEAFDGKIMPAALQEALQFAIALFKAADMAEVTAPYSEHIRYDAAQKQFVTKSNGDGLYTVFAIHVKAPGQRTYSVSELREQAAKEILLNYKKDPELSALIINAMQAERASLERAFFAGLHTLSSSFSDDSAVKALCAKMIALQSQQNREPRANFEAVTQLLADLNALQEVPGQVAAIAHTGKIRDLESFCRQFESELILMPYFHDTASLHVAIEKYCERVRKMGSWSGLAEVYALAKACNCSIYLRKQDGKGSFEEDRKALDLLPHTGLEPIEVPLDFRDGFVSS